MEGNNEFLGTEPVGKLLFRLSIPTVVAQLVNMLYYIVDRMTTLQPSVPICEKDALTLEEAAAFLNIGINKLREITTERNSAFVFFVGNKPLIKHKRFEQYLDRVFSL